ncbi:MAG: hypothetical protein HUK24_06900 [Sphaerochaetaceae bacterium]|nr:hypothetical protein [Sphaerochaetaceae bacterium]
MFKKIFIVVLVLISSFNIFALEENLEVDTYYYNTLNPTEQIAYDAFYHCVTHLIESWNIGSLSQEVLDKSYLAMILDHPEVFWVEDYTYVTSFVGNEISQRKIEFNYLMSREEIEVANNTIQDGILDIFQNIGSIDSQYDLVRGVYDWFVKNCTYNELNLDQTLYSAIVKKNGVCASFSKAFQFIMQCMGIPSISVDGELKSGYTLLSSIFGHEWTMVYLDGSWYHVDVTSAISSFKDNVINYSFLLVPTSLIEKTHVLDEGFILPNANDDSLVFYNRFGTILESYTREKASTALGNSMALWEGKPLEVRFSQYRAYKDAFEDLINNQGIFSVIQDITGKNPENLNYSISEEELVLRVYLD